MEDWAFLCCTVLSLCCTSAGPGGVAAPSAAADQPPQLPQSNVAATQHQAPPTTAPPAASTQAPQPQPPPPWSTPLASLLLPGTQRVVGPLLPSAEAKSSRLDPQQEVALLRFFSVQDKVSRTEAEVLANQVLPLFPTTSVAGLKRLTGLPGA